MVFFSALNKLFKIRKEKSYYNSDYILTMSEKQSLIIGGFLLIFPLILIAAIILTNNIS